MYILFKSRKNKNIKKNDPKVLMKITNIKKYMVYKIQRNNYKKSKQLQTNFA